VHLSEAESIWGAERRQSNFSKAYKHHLDNGIETNSKCRRKGLTLCKFLHDGSNSKLHPLLYASKYDTDCGGGDYAPFSAKPAILETTISLGCPLHSRWHDNQYLQHHVVRARCRRERTTASRPGSSPKYFPTILPLLPSISILPLTSALRCFR